MKPAHRPRPFTTAERRRLVLRHRWSGPISTWLGTNPVRPFVDRSPERAAEDYLAWLVARVPDEVIVAAIAAGDSTTRKTRTRRPRCT